MGLENVCLSAPYQYICHHLALQPLIPNSVRSSINAPVKAEGVVILGVDLVVVVVVAVAVAVAMWKALSEWPPCFTKTQRVEKHIRHAKQLTIVALGMENFISIT